MTFLYPAYILSLLNSYRIHGVLLRIHPKQHTYCSLYYVCSKSYWIFLSYRKWSDPIVVSDRTRIGLEDDSKSIVGWTQDELGSTQVCEWLLEEETNWKRNYSSVNHFLCLKQLQSETIQSWHLFQIFKSSHVVNTTNKKEKRAIEIRDYTSPPGERTKCNHDYVSSPKSGVITCYSVVRRVWDVEVVLIQSSKINDIPSPVLYSAAACRSNRHCFKAKARSSSGAKPCDPGKGRVGSDDSGFRRTQVITITLRPPSGRTRVISNYISFSFILRHHLLLRSCLKQRRLREEKQSFYTSNNFFFIWLIISNYITIFNHPIVFRHIHIAYL